MIAVLWQKDSPLQGLLQQHLWLDWESTSNYSFYSTSYNLKFAYSFNYITEQLLNMLTAWKGLVHRIIAFIEDLVSNILSVYSLITSAAEITETSFWEIPLTWIINTFKCNNQIWNSKSCLEEFWKWPKIITWVSVTVE